MTINVRKATADNLGVVKIGAGLTINDDGLLSIGGADMFDIINTPYNFVRKPITANRKYNIFPTPNDNDRPIYYNRSNEILTLAAENIKLRLRGLKAYHISISNILQINSNTVIYISPNSSFSLTPVIGFPQIPTAGVICTSGIPNIAAYNDGLLGAIEATSGDDGNILPALSAGVTLDVVMYNTTASDKVININPGLYASATFNSQYWSNISNVLDGQYQIIVTPMDNGEIIY